MTKNEKYTLEIILVCTLCAFTAWVLFLLTKQALVATPAPVEVNVSSTTNFPPPQKSFIPIQISKIPTVKPANLNLPPVSIPDFMKH